jgi:hypothetical protein
VRFRLRLPWEFVQVVEQDNETITARIEARSPWPWEAREMAAEAAAKLALRNWAERNGVEYP